MHKVSLFSLSLIVRNPTRTGLYERLPSYILEQRHFYPLFPPRPDSRVAIQESGLGEFLGGTPDILILPSELQYFVKVGLNRYKLISRSWTGSL